MARFMWMGERPRPGVTYGKTTAIRLNNSEGGQFTVSPTNGDCFVVGEDLGHDFTDARTLRHMRADPRFKEVI